MANGGLESTFNFLSYKVDCIKLSIIRDIGVLRLDGNYSQHEWIQNFNIRNPVFFSKQKIYVCAVDTIIELRPIKADSEEGVSWLTLEVGIAGLFSVRDKLEESLEKKFVAITAPAILFPFLRASCTNLLASSGFGSVVMPLVNMYKVGEKVSKREDFSVHIVD